MCKFVLVPKARNGHWLAKNNNTQLNGSGCVPTYFWLEIIFLLLKLLHVVRPLKLADAVDRRVSLEMTGAGRRQAVKISSRRRLYEAQ